MDIEDILLEAIESNQFIEFLRGEGKFKIEMSEYAPVAEITDIGKILSKGIYRVYVYNKQVESIFKENLLEMLDISDFDIYMVINYLASQFFKEKNGLSPFVLAKEEIIEKLSIKLKERESYIKEGVLYPNGYFNTNAMQEINRLRIVLKEEYGISIN